MGEPMALRLLAAGYSVRVWNRSIHKTQALAAAGAQVSNTPAQACAQANVIITMLTDGQAVHEVLFGGPHLAASESVSAAHKQGALFIDMSSIAPDQARSHAAQLDALGMMCLDAPVSGGTLGAQAGTLAIMAGGTAEAFDAARDLLQHLGRPVHVGPTGCGQLTKLANQIIVGVSIGAVAEALLLTQQGGADIAQVRLALRGGFAESRILEVHGQRMVEQDFAKRGSLAVQLKDLRNAQETAQKLGFDAPITNSMTALYSQAAEEGDANLDQSALYLSLARRQNPQSPK